MKKFLLVLFLIIPSITFGASAGFLESDLWFSNDIFFAGNKVRLYTGVVNSSAYDIKGSVTFFDGSEEIATKDFQIERGGNFVRLWIDWTPFSGEHQLWAKIINPKDVGSGNPVNLSNNVTRKLKINVDLDTDGDGLGNKVDLDDDGDGVNDGDEITLGTDPVVKNILNDFVANGDDFKERSYNPIVIDPNRFATSTVFGGKVVPFVNDLLIGVQELDQTIASNFSGVIEKLSKEKIEAVHERSELPSGKSAFVSNVYIVILSILIFVFVWRLIVYVLIFCVVFKFLRWVISKIREWKQNREL